MNAKIKNFRTFMDPYTVVVGDKEAADNTVSLTIRGQKKQLHDVPLEKFVEACKKMNKEYMKELITEM